MRLSAHRCEFVLSVFGRIEHRQGVPGSRFADTHSLPGHRLYRKTSRRLSVFEAFLCFAAVCVRVCSHPTAIQANATKNSFGTCAADVNRKPSAAESPLRGEPDELEDSAMGTLIITRRFLESHRDPFVVYVARHGAVDVECKTRYLCVLSSH